MKFHKNTSLEAEVLHVNGWMDITKLTVAFWNFANVAKNTIHSGCDKRFVV